MYRLALLLVTILATASVQANCEGNWIAGTFTCPDNATTPWISAGSSRATPVRLCRHGPGGAATTEGCLLLWNNEAALASDRPTMFIPWKQADLPSLLLRLNRMADAGNSAGWCDATPMRWQPVAGTRTQSTTPGEASWTVTEECIGPTQACNQTCTSGDRRTRQGPVNLAEASETWSPATSTQCQGISFTQTSSKGRTRFTTGTKPCPKTPETWSPATGTQCQGTSFTQTSSKGRTRFTTGTKPCPKTPETWSPATGTQCQGTSFTQTSSKGRTRSATGTKSCPETWSPEINTVCLGERYTQTSNRGRTRTRTGTRPCPETWSPDLSTVCQGDKFTQTSSRGRTRQRTGTKDCPEVWEPDPATRCLGDVFTQTSNRGRTRSVVGTKKSCTVDDSPKFGQWVTIRSELQPYQGAAPRWAVGRVSLISGPYIPVILTGRCQRPDQRVVMTVSQGTICLAYGGNGCSQQPSRNTYHEQECR